MTNIQSSISKMVSPVIVFALCSINNTLIKCLEMFITTVLTAQLVVLNSVKPASANHELLN